ncbi:MAG: hypothetical protein FD155_1868 [Bacteroidetes bacterium]|nr:MAG: hypothetical protein FD155_1868 [Bacteroidota bacterium]
MSSIKIFEKKRLEVIMILKMRFGSFLLLMWLKYLQIAPDRENAGMP